MFYKRLAPIINGKFATTIILPTSFYHSGITNSITFIYFISIEKNFKCRIAVNPNTMQRALAKLGEDGLIITQRTSGRWITEDARMVEKAKTKLAQKQILEFLEKIQLIGFKQKELLTIINNMLKKMKQ